MFRAKRVLQVAGMIEFVQMRILPLQLLLPLIGAAVLGVLRCGPALARRIALVNVAGSLGLAAVSFLSARRQLLPMDPANGLSTVLTWRFPDAASLGAAQYEFAIDGINIFPVLIIPMIIWCLVVHEWQRAGRAQLALLLVAEAILLAQVTAQDVMSYSGLLIATGFVIPWVGTFEGSAGCRAMARRLMALQLSAAFLVLIGLAGVTAGRALMLGAPHSPPGPPERNLTLLIRGVRELVGLSPPAEIIWGQLSVWLFLSLAVGFTLWTAVAPLHLASLNALRSSSAIGRVLIGAVSLKLGVLGWVKIVVPLFPEHCAALGPVVLLWCFAGTAYLAVRFISESEAATIGALTALLGSVLPLAAVLALTPLGLRGAALYIIGQMPPLAVLLLFEGSDSAAPIAWRRCAVLAAAGVPGLSVFPGLLLCLTGCLGSAVWQAIGWPVPIVLYCAAVGISAAVALRGQNPSAGSMQWRSAVAVGPLALVSLWIGIQPQAVFELLDLAVAQLISN